MQYRTQCFIVYINLEKCLPAANRSIEFCGLLGVPEWTRKSNHCVSVSGWLPGQDWKVMKMALWFHCRLPPARLGSLKYASQISLQHNFPSEIHLRPTIVDPNLSYNRSQPEHSQKYTITRCSSNSAHDVARRWARHQLGALQGWDSVLFCGTELHAWRDYGSHEEHARIECNVCISMSWQKLLTS